MLMQPPFIFFEILECIKRIFVFEILTVLRKLAMKSYTEIIAINPNNRSGKPSIRNLRITVADVLSYLASGMTTKEIISDFPQLTEEDIRACLSYAADSEKHIKFISVG